MRRDVLARYRRRLGSHCRLLWIWMTFYSVAECGKPVPANRIWNTLSDPQFRLHLHQRQLLTQFEPARLLGLRRASCVLVSNHATRWKQQKTAPRRTRTMLTNVDVLPPTILQSKTIIYVRQPAQGWEQYGGAPPIWWRSQDIVASAPSRSSMREPGARRVGWSPDQDLTSSWRRYAPARLALSCVSTLHASLVMVATGIICLNQVRFASRKARSSTLTSRLGDRVSFPGCRTSPSPITPSWVVGPGRFDRSAEAPADRPNRSSLPVSRRPSSCDRRRRGRGQGSCCARQSPALGSVRDGS